MKNIEAVDLNLMTAFEAMLLEQSVSRAADRVGLAQPSMSNALARLRGLFDDPLFVRSGGRMVPTERAQALKPYVVGALDTLRQALNDGGRFDPATTSRGFRLAISDYGEQLLIPALLRLLREAAPGVQLHCLPFDRGRLAEQFEQGEIDAALGVSGKPAARLAGEPQFHESFVCVARQDHPLLAQAPGMDLDRFLACDHVLVSRTGPGPGALDLALSGLGHRRRVALTVANFASLAAVVSQSDLIGAMAERLARKLAPGLGLAVCPVPVDLTGFTVSLVWNETTAADAGQMWFRDQVRAVCRESA